MDKWKVRLLRIREELAPGFQDVLDTAIKEIEDEFPSARDGALEEAARVCRQWFEQEEGRSLREIIEIDDRSLATYGKHAWNQQYIAAVRALDALRSPEHAAASAVPDEIMGRCCYGGTKRKKDCASCAAWTPVVPQPVGATPASPASGADGMPEEPTRYDFEGMESPDGALVFYSDWKELADAIRQWALRRPAPRDAGWVSVKERLPNCGGTYIVGGFRTEAPELFDQEYCGFRILLDGPTWEPHNTRPINFPIQYWCDTPAAPTEERG